MPTIAVLSTSPALASILGATLRQGRNWRVREFRDPRALNAYMRIAPVAMLVCDYSLGDSTAADLAGTIREDAFVVSRQVQILAMSRSIDSDMRQRCVQAGIDEVIAKPMSPLYLEERVRARLANGARDYVISDTGYIGPERRDRIVLSDPRTIPVERRGENVVSFLAHKALRARKSDTRMPE